MGSVNPTTAIAVLIVLAAIINIVCNVIKTVHSVRRRPPLGEDTASMAARLKAVERDVSRKQDSRVCAATHAEWERDVAEIKSRHSAHENKLSKQIGGVHDRINAVFGELRELIGIVKAKESN